MMRKITTHVENDRQPKLLAGENVAPGNAPQKYVIMYDEASGTPNVVNLIELDINFISLESDGVTNEVLLAIVIDRLEGFQAGPFACEENQNALDAARLSLETLHSRTRERLNRGVENKHEK